MAPSAVPITPFWQRLPRFFLFPLAPRTLGYLLFLSACCGLGLILPLGKFFKIVVTVVACIGAWLALTRYAYGVLEETAQGHLTPEDYDRSDTSHRNSLPYKQFGVFFVMGLALGLCAMLGRFAAFVAQTVVNLSMPASIMVLTLTGSTGAALNPVGLWRVIRGIGLPYLGLCAFLFLLSLGGPELLKLVGPRLPLWAMVPGINFILMYFSLIMFNLMGYVLYQYHGSLGLAAEGDGGQVVPEDDRTGDPGERIAALISAGQVDQALDVAYEAQRLTPEDFRTQDRYLKLLLLGHKTERFLSHARTVLPTYLARGRLAEAWALWCRCRQLDGAWETSESTVLALAQAAARGRDFRGALEVMKGFDRRYPGHGDIPAIYLLSAQILCEQFHQDPLAGRILETLKARYPDHPLRTEAERYLATLARLAQA